MARTPPKSNFGRPKLEIDWEKFDMMCQLQCTLIEIAGWFDCSVDTIERAVQEHSSLTFAEYHGRLCGKGNISLRRAQYQKALAGNTQMMIWLGKQRLGQSDKALVNVYTNDAEDLPDEALVEIKKRYGTKKARFDALDDDGE